jgi:maltose O-acetyltransferase
MLRQVHLRLRLANIVCGALPDFGSGALRGRLYRAVGLDIADSAFIMGNLELLAGSPNGFYDKLHIGSGTVLGNHITINLDADVHIGANVSLSPFVRIYTGTHHLGPGSNRRLDPLIAKTVVIEDGCWIGLGAMILPGVTVGHGSIVAAGAVVTEGVPADSYVEGNPARVIRQLPWGDR